MRSVASSCFLIPLDHELTSLPRLCLSTTSLRLALTGSLARRRTFTLASPPELVAAPTHLRLRPLAHPSYLHPLAIHLVLPLLLHAPSFSSSTRAPSRAARSDAWDLVHARQFPTSHLQTARPTDRKQHRTEFGSQEVTTSEEIDHPRSASPLRRLRRGCC